MSTERPRIWCERCKRFHIDEPVDIDKIAADMAQEMADEIDREVLQELLNLARKEVPVEPQHIPELWAQLKDLEPIYSGGSLHVWEAHYTQFGVRYAVYWEIGGNDVPFEIAILRD